MKSSPTENTGPIPRAIMAIDTSGPVCSIAVTDPSGAITDISSDGLGDHFERISELVLDLLKRADILNGDIAELRVGVGPGSFTGLRIGLSFAKGFAFANQIPLIGCCSFLGVAYSVAFQKVSDYPPAQRLLVVADARRDELFLGEYSIDKGARREAVLKVCREPCIVPASEVFSWKTLYPAGLILSPDPNLKITGLEDGIYFVRDISRGLLYRDTAALNAKVDFTPSNERGVVKLAEVQPNYLRAVAAKTIKERQGG